MRSPEPYRRVGPALFDGPCHSHCRVSVIIPARNEEAHLARSLDALRDQRDLANDPLDPTSYEVLLFLNNCTDASPAVVERYKAQFPEFPLSVASGDLAPDQAHVGTARRWLMDAAYERLCEVPGAAILSTDADTVVAPDWIARNLTALDRGADVVGGVIHLFPAELAQLQREEPDVALAYARDRELQGMVAYLESLLDPDLADPWPRHLEHFGASLACTAEIYARAGGLPPVKPLEDVAFIDALRKIGARIRHCPETHIFTSARMDGRAEVGLSGQLRHWREESGKKLPHLADSGEWLEHRFRSLAALRQLNEAERLRDLSGYPVGWHRRLEETHRLRLRTPRFLEVVDCNALIEETFRTLGLPRQAPIVDVLADLPVRITQAEGAARREDLESVFSRR